MSADLFAEFGASLLEQGAQTEPGRGFSNGLSPGSVSNTQPQPRSSAQAVWSLASASSTPVEELGDSDEWGDFEGGSSIEVAKRNPSAPAPPGTTLFASKSIAPGSRDSAWHKTLVFDASQPSRPLNSSVSIDAEGDADNEDDFGDFEEAQEIVNVPIKPKSQSSGILEDLDLSHSGPSAFSGKKGNVARQTKSDVNTRKNSSSTHLSTFSSNPRSSPTISWTKKKKHDAWEEFDDWEASDSTTVKQEVAPNTLDPIMADTSNKSFALPTPVLPHRIADAQPGESPPTNIPPPGILLSLFPIFFVEAQERLFKPIMAQAPPVRNKLLVEKATTTYLQGYLCLAGVAAHIIAGRRLRWKRDHHLSQGMKIGPASSRATSGMKLTGIDKGENMKEEREVSEVVRVWEEQAGRLRHIVSAVNQIKAGMLGKIPQIQEVMSVKTLKQAEGGMPARQPCMLCGLKRDERVTAADMATEDSFGEWWVDQANMHRGCRNFWNEHRDRLR